MSLSPSAAVLTPMIAASASSLARSAGPLSGGGACGGQQINQQGLMQDDFRLQPTENGGRVPLRTTYSPILSATAPSRPFSSTISRRTSDQGDCTQTLQRSEESVTRQKAGSGEDGGLTLSSLSTAEEMARVDASGTPQREKIPSRIFR